MLPRSGRIVSASGIGTDSICKEKSGPEVSIRDTSRRGCCGRSSSTLRSQDARARETTRVHRLSRKGTGIVSSTLGLSEP
jgi:hypothetical protein